MTVNVAERERNAVDMSDKNKDEGAHTKNVIHDGQGKYDHSTTKPVEESSGGKHSKDDKGEEK